MSRSSHGNHGSVVRELKPSLSSTLSLSAADQRAINSAIVRTLEAEKKKLVAEHSRKLEAMDAKGVFSHKVNQARAELLLRAAIQKQINIEEVERRIVNEYMAKGSVQLPPEIDPSTPVARSKSVQSNSRKSLMQRLDASIQLSHAQSSVGNSSLNSGTQSASSSRPISKTGSRKRETVAFATIVKEHHQKEKEKDRERDKEKEKEKALIEESDAEVSAIHHHQQQEQHSNASISQQVNTSDWRDTLNLSMSEKLEKARLESRPATSLHSHSSSSHSHSPPRDASHAHAQVKHGSPASPGGHPPPAQRPTSFYSPPSSLTVDQKVDRLNRRLAKATFKLEYMPSPSLLDISMNKTLPSLPRPHSSADTFSASVSHSQASTSPVTQMQHERRKNTEHAMFDAQVEEMERIVVTLCRAQERGKVLELSADVVQTRRRLIDLLERVCEHPVFAASLKLHLKEERVLWIQRSWLKAAETLFGWDFGASFMLQAGNHAQLDMLAKHFAATAREMWRLAERKRREQSQLSMEDVRELEELDTKLHIMQVYGSFMEPDDFKHFSARCEQYQQQHHHQQQHHQQQLQQQQQQQHQHSDGPVAGMFSESGVRELTKDRMLRQLEKQQLWAQYGGRARIRRFLDYIYTDDPSGNHMVYVEGDSMAVGLLPSNLSLSQSSGVQAAQSQSQSQSQSQQSQSQMPSSTSLDDMEWVENRAEAVLNSEEFAQTIVDLERIWSSLYMPPQEKFALLNKYNRPEYADRVARVRELWAEVAHNVRAREDALSKLEEMQKGVEERKKRQQAALLHIIQPTASSPGDRDRPWGDLVSTDKLDEEKQRAALYAQLGKYGQRVERFARRLGREFGDKVLYKGAEYLVKMRDDYTRLLFQLEQQRLAAMLQSNHV